MMTAFLRATTSLAYSMAPYDPPPHALNQGARGRGRQQGRAVAYMIYIFTHTHTHTHTHTRT